ncbi:hypothetical protein NKI56_32940, partial [Mesorhizobium sp. M0622]|uniref:hypothetical protein n=1 Tax=Mesorhizobium sp. M0622 TaxID=2956975 RepID=UPI003339C269
MAGRPEGVAAREAPTFSFVPQGVAPAEATPSFALGGKSTSRGEIGSFTDAAASGMFAISVE